MRSYMARRIFWSEKHLQASWSDNKGPLALIEGIVSCARSWFPRPDR